jgi:hypothetical protein
LLRNRRLGVLRRSRGGCAHGESRSCRNAAQDSRDDSRGPARPHAAFLRPQNSATARSAQGYSGSPLEPSPLRLSAWRAAPFPAAR